MDLGRLLCYDYDNVRWSIGPCVNEIFVSIIGAPADNIYILQLCSAGPGRSIFSPSRVYHFTRIGLRISRGLLPGGFHQSGWGLAPQDRLHIKIDRLRNAQLREPASIWAKRSTLLMGLLLIDADPAEAGSLLQSVQADFPHLDDYIRLWMGEAQAKLGDMAQAAALFESIIESPDSILLARASFRAGESWYRVGQCGKAVDHLTRGMALAPTILTLRPPNLSGGVLHAGQSHRRQPSCLPPSMDAVSQLAGSPRSISASIRHR